MMRNRVLTLVQFPSEDLLPEMQEVLAALADIEVHFSAERETIERSTACEQLRGELSEHLEALRASARNPLVQRLEALYRETALPIFARVRMTEAMH